MSFSLRSGFPRGIGGMVDSQCIEILHTYLYSLLVGSKIVLWLVMTIGPIVVFIHCPPENDALFILLLILVIMHMLAMLVVTAHLAGR